MWPSVIATVVGALLLVETCQARCPHQILIRPCECKITGFELKMVCNKTKYSAFKEQDIIKTFTHWKNIKIWLLEMEGFDFKYFPDNAFKDLHIEHIMVMNSKFEGKQTKKIFGGLENMLSKIIIDSSGLQSSDNLIFTNFNYLPKLTILQINSRYVEVVNKQWTKSMPKSLKELRINGGEVINIADHAFQKFNNITSFDINSNKVKTVKRSIFPEKPTQLREINLRKNLIETIPPDLFSDMSSLESVKLDNNKLKYLDEPTWKFILNVDFIIEIYNNPFHCTEEMRWLTNVFDKLLEDYQPKCEEPEDYKGVTIKDYVKNLGKEDNQRKTQTEIVQKRNEPRFKLFRFIMPRMD